MPICIILLKILRVRRALNRIKQVKLNTYRRSIGLPPKYGCCEKLWKWTFGCFKNILLFIFCGCCFCIFSKGKTLWEIFWTEGTLPNAILKSFIGLTVGIIFTNILIAFFIFQLNFDVGLTTYIGIAMGGFMSLGLALSQTVRCFTFLIIPQFFTKKGRTAILAYCLILALSGPGKNTTTNMEILTESLLCSQQMAHNATQGIINLVRNPYSAMAGALKSMADAVKDASRTIMFGLRNLTDLIMSVVGTIKSVFKFLKEVTSFCNSKVGSPSTKCRAAFDGAIEDCNVKLGHLGWMCSVVELVKHLCQIAEWSEDFVCWLPRLAKEVIFEPIKNGLHEVGNGIKRFFDVRIRFDHELEGSFTSSKTFKEIVRGMRAEILEEVHWFIQYMDWVNLLTSLFMGLAIYKALAYRYRFRLIDSHDNFYLTKGVVELDIRMRRIGRPAMFPLKYHEAFTFVEPFSLVLVKAEKSAMNLQLSFLGIAAVKILSYIFIDYAFYSFLLLVQTYGAIHLDSRKLLGHGVAISGNGFLADMYRAILAALSPIGTLLPVFDTTPCLPVASKPNFYRYAMIFFLLILAFLCCITEPYGMRLRHIICGIYYPERKLPRDRWLYTHIRSARGNFLSFARSQMQAVISNGRVVYRVGLFDRIYHISPCFRTVLRLFRVQTKKCFVCGQPGDLDDSENFVRCPRCDSVYCNVCYDDMGNQCVTCMSPIEFGDTSDESGSHSSDEDDKEMSRQSDRKFKYRKLESLSPSSTNFSREILLPTLQNGIRYELRLDSTLSESEGSLLGQELESDTIKSEISSSEQFLELGKKLVNREDSMRSNKSDMPKSSATSTLKMQDSDEDADYSIEVDTDDSKDYSFGKRVQDEGVYTSLSDESETDSDMLKFENSSGESYGAYPGSDTAQYLTTETDEGSGERGGDFDSDELIKRQSYDSLNQNKRDLILDLPIGTDSETFDDEESDTVQFKPSAFERSLGEFRTNVGKKKLIENVSKQNFNEDEKHSSAFRVQNTDSEKFHAHESERTVPQYQQKNSEHDHSEIRRDSQELIGRHFNQSNKNPTQEHEEVGRSDSEESPTTDESEESLSDAVASVHSNRSRVFREDTWSPPVGRYINPKLRDRVKLLDEFYAKMPYPPMSNL